MSQININKWKYRKVNKNLSENQLKRFWVLQSIMKSKIKIKINTKEENKYNMKKMIDLIRDKISRNSKN